MDASKEESKVAAENVTEPWLEYITKGSRHSIGIDSKGIAYSWGRSNAVGQLGRDDGCGANKPAPVDLSSAENVEGVKQKAMAKKAYVSQGSGTGSGHSAILDMEGMLWMTGCDRWQQLGLGSSKGGSSGYTWQGGKLWQDKFVPSVHALDLMRDKGEKDTPQPKVPMIRDVALGGDHTLVLSSDQQSVYGFGKGGDGQLGLVGKPFVSAPIKSTVLSSKSGDSDGGTKIAAICAVKACSFTLDSNGKILKQTGRCRSVIQDEIGRCISQAKLDGLLPLSVEG